MSSFIEQIIPEAQKIPRAEIVDVAHNGTWAHVTNLEGLNWAEKGDALKALCTTCYCREGWIQNPDIEYHKIVIESAKVLNLIEPINWNGLKFRTDTVIIGHGPLAERAGGVPSLGIDNHYPSWLNTANNDGEITMISLLSKENLERALRLGVKRFTHYDKHKRGSTWNTEIKHTDWIEPSWNIDPSTNQINKYMRTSYTYFRKTEFPALDLHTISSENPIEEFLTVYGDSYSNIFGARFLVGFIKQDGSLEQKIWQPIKPEKAPKKHTISLTRPEQTCSMPWILAESIRMALDTVRYSKIAKKEAEIDPKITSLLTESIKKQVAKTKAIKGEEWMKQNLQKKLATAYHRAKLFDKEKGVEKINQELQRISWFKEVGI